MKYSPPDLGGAVPAARRARCSRCCRSIAAFLLFGMLDAVRAAFDSGGQSVAGVDRLVDRVALSRSSSRCRCSLEPQHRSDPRRAATSPTRTGSAASTRTRRTSFQLRGQPELPRPVSRDSCCPPTSARPSTRRAPARSSARAWRRSYRLEGRRQDAAAVDHLPAEERQQDLDVRHRRHLHASARTRRTALRPVVHAALEVLRRGQRVTAAARSAGTSTS